jgi:hypothetical protein
MRKMMNNMKNKMVIKAMQVKAIVTNPSGEGFVDTASASVRA